MDILTVSNAAKRYGAVQALGGASFALRNERDSAEDGAVTFNAWALDGYLKVFWRNAAVWELWPQVLVLSLLGAAFFAIARLLGRRWEFA